MKYAVLSSENNRDGFKQAIVEAELFNEEGGDASAFFAHPFAWTAKLDGFVEIDNAQLLERSIFMSDD